MWKTFDSRSPRVVEIRRAADPARPSITPPPGLALAAFLAKLRAEMDGLALRLSREHGTASETAVRAEQIAHAIQRLEWALERESGYPPAG